MTGEVANPLPATHIDMRYIVAGGDVTGQVVHLPRPLPTALFSLPPPPARLAGRVADLEALLTELAPASEDGQDTGTRESCDGSSGVVVSALAGMGGVGKTALALAAGAIAHHKEWFCAQLYVDLRGYTPGAEPLSAQAALDVLLRQVGVDPEDIPPKAAERASFYRSALARLSQVDERGRPVMVVADNSRSAAQVRPLLPGPGRHRLVATTRGGLHSLTGARHLDLDVLDSDAAIALLGFALTANDPEDPRAADQEALGRLARLCGHLPLALEIAAAQLARKPRLTPARLAERLEQATSRVDKLKDHGPDSERSRVLRAVFDTSLDQLSLEEARVFLLVAAAPGPTTSTTAAAVFTGMDEDGVEEVLEELQAAHLLTQPAPGRWGAHDLLADHATSHPHPPRDRDEAWGRLLGHYTIATRAADDHVWVLPGQPVPDLFTDQEAALGWLDAERPTLVSAALAAPGLGHTEAAIDLPLHLAQYLDRRRRFEELEQVSRSAQAVAHTHGDQTSEAMACTNLGNALQQLRRFEEAIDAHTRARDLHHQVRNACGEAMAWNNLGNALQQVRRFSEAINALIVAGKAFNQAGETHNEATAWNNLGSALQQVRRFGHAIQAHTLARGLYHQVGDTLGEAMACTNLGNALQQLRRFEEAIQAHTRARDLHHQVGDTHGEAMAWNSLGLALLDTGEKGEAVEALTEAGGLFESTGDYHSAAAVRDRIARIRQGSDSGEPA